MKPRSKRKKKFYFCRLLVYFLIAALWTGNALGEIVASRTMGVAPLGVSFNADFNAFDQNDKPFHRLDYAWDFGDAANDGAWAVSGKSKNGARGPVAAHVFETPGVYTVTLTIADQTRTISSETIQITVQDPEIVYAGDNTVCFSDTVNADFTGCPDNALKITTDDVSRFKSAAAPGKRLLLHRGSTWTASSLNDDEKYIGRGIQGPFTFGAYGARLNPDERGICENAPVINLGFTDDTVDGNATFFSMSRTSDIRIRDIAFNAPKAYGSLAGGATEIGPFLFLRVKTEGFGIPIAVSGYLTGNHQQLMVVDGSFSNMERQGIFAGSERLVLLGNDFRNVDQSHVARIWQAYYGVIGHNVFSGASIENNNGRLNLKLHGLREELLNYDWGRGTTFHRNRTRFVVVSDNVFGGSGPWNTYIGPQNAVSDERLTDIIIENNRFFADYGRLSPRKTTSLLHVSGGNISIRNNVLDGNGSDNSLIAMVVEQLGAEPRPYGVSIENNTVYKTDTADDPGAYTMYAAFQVEDLGEEISIINNLAIFPDNEWANQIFLIRNRDGSPLTADGNLLIQGEDTGLKAPEHADHLLRDYRPTAYSQAVDQGTGAGVLRDFSGMSRAATLPVDIGAFEYTPTPNDDQPGQPDEPNEPNEPDEPEEPGEPGEPSDDPQPPPLPPSNFFESYEGVAPFGVHFSADAPQSAPGHRPFHGLDYTWDFDEPGGEAWAVSGKAKNSAKGPLTAHVFETPGRYEVSLTVSSGMTVVDKRYYEVTVLDPDELFAGGDTICFNSDENLDFNGCPDGALQFTTDKVSDIKAAAAPGKRILLRRGSSWSSEGVDPGERFIAHRMEGPVTFGAFGEKIDPDERGICANAPVIHLTHPSAGNYDAFFGLSGTSNLRIRDITFNADKKYGSLAGGAGSMENILFLRVKTTGFNLPISTSSYRSSVQDRIMVVDSDFTDARTHLLYTGSQRLVLMGNRFSDAGLSHAARIHQAYEGVISHNVFSGSSLDTYSGRHALKLHGPREEILNTEWGTMKRTRQVLIADNLFGGSGPWTASIGPQNAVYDERLSDLIIENNRFFADYGNLSTRLVSTLLHVHASHVSIRNNVLDGTGSGSGFIGMVIKRRGIEPLPEGVHVFNNTVHKTSVEESAGQYRLYAGIQVEEIGEDVRIMNNLVVFPENGYADSVSLIRNRDDSDIAADSGNLLIQGETPGFRAADLEDPLMRDFRLTPGSPAVDQGVFVPIFRDFDGEYRSAPMDIGAFELSGNN